MIKLLYTQAFYTDTLIGFVYMYVYTDSTFISIYIHGKTHLKPF